MVGNRSKYKKTYWIILRKCINKRENCKTHECRFCGKQSISRSASWPRNCEMDWALLIWKLEWKEY